MNSKQIAVGIGTFAIVGAVGIAPASADFERERTKSCSSGAFAQLSLEKEYGPWTEVDFEVDQAPSNSRWTVRIKHRGNTVLKTTRFADREGELDVDTRVRDRKGTGKVKVRAKSTTGEVCNVALRLR